MKYSLTFTKISQSFEKIKTRFARLKQKTNGSVAQRWLSLGF